MKRDLRQRPQSVRESSGAASCVFERHLIEIQHGSHHYIIQCDSPGPSTVPLTI